MASAPVADVVRPPSEEPEAWVVHRRVADRVFKGALSVAAVITAIWLSFLLTGADGGLLFGGYEFDLVAVARVIGGVGISYVLWGWLWYGVKRQLLLKLVGLSHDEVRAVFQSRMNAPFDLASILRGRSERRIRIVDMIGRRGRFAIIAVVGFSYIYRAVARDPQPYYLLAGVQQNLFDGVAFSWIMLATFRSDGFMGRVMFGAQSRIMDGTSGRANCLLITTLWGLFKFVMVPIGVQLAGLFPPSTYAALFAFIWLSYSLSDALSEIVGSLIGKQKLRVWGIGEVNRKSLAGTWACFLGSLTLCLTLVFANGLPPPGSPSPSRCRCPTSSSSWLPRAAQTTSRWRPPTPFSAAASG